MRTLPNKNGENTDQMLALIPDRVKAALTVAIEKINGIKWKSVEFIIPIVPEPSHRPRLCGYRVYVPGAAKHQKFFQMRVLPKLNGLFINTPCKIDVDIYVKTPTSFTKTQRILAEMKILRPWVNTGDIDNYDKAVFDMMQPNKKRKNRGIMLNDSLIIESHSNKYYSIDPRYEIRLSFMDRIPEELLHILRLDKFDDGPDDEE